MGFLKPSLKADYYLFWKKKLQLSLRGASYVMNILDHIDPWLVSISCISV